MLAGLFAEVRESEEVNKAVLGSFWYIRSDRTVVEEGPRFPRASCECASGVSG